MLRELIDTAVLEDFASGLARSSGLRVCVYDADGELLVASAASNDFARLTGWVLGHLPPHMTFVPVPAHNPPAQIAYVEHVGVWYVVAPVYVEDQPSGYVAVGEFRGHTPAGETWRKAHAAAAVDLNDLVQAWDTLPPLDRSGLAQPVVAARWGARMLAHWGHRESQLISAASEVALVGDIAELLTGDQDLQTVLDHIVADTARVMQCPFASIRLYDEKADELTVAAVYNLPRDYSGPHTLRLSENPISREALRGKIVYVEDITTDPRSQYPEQARRLGFVSMLAAGLMHRGKPVGMIRVYTDRKRRFRKAQRDLLRAVAYQAATGIVHAQLMAERLRTAEVQRQLKLAGELQARVMRSGLPEHPYLDRARVYAPSQQVGGDLGEFLALGDGTLVAVVADVVGKGVPASLLVSFVRGVLRALAAVTTRLDEFMNTLNRLLCRELRPSEFITLLMVGIASDARTLTYVNAGHEPLLLLRDGRVQPTLEAGLVLGVSTDEVYKAYTLALQPDDFLLLYTDGAFEARNFADEQFGRQRLWESLAQWGNLQPQQALSNILWDVRRYVGLAEQADDLTLVGLRLRPRGAAPAAPPESAV